MKLRRKLLALKSLAERFRPKWRKCWPRVRSARQVGVVHVRASTGVTP